MIILSERNREYVKMLVKFRSEGVSYKEIAKVIPRSVSTLKKWGTEFRIEIDDTKHRRAYYL